MKNIFELNMFWILLIILLVMIWYIDLSDMNTWDTKRTMGWDYTSIKGSITLFLCGYGLISVLKKSSNFLLSFLHFLLMMILFFIPMISAKLGILLGALIWIVFVLNIIVSLRSE